MIHEKTALTEPLPTHRLGTNLEEMFSLHPEVDDLASHLPGDGEGSHSDPDPSWNPSEPAAHKFCFL